MLLQNIKSPKSFFLIPATCGLPANWLRACFELVADLSSDLLRMNINKAKGIKNVFANKRALGRFESGLFEGKTFEKSTFETFKSQQKPGQNNATISIEEVNEYVNPPGLVFTGVPHPPITRQTTTNIERGRFHIAKEYQGGTGTVEGGEISSTRKCSDDEGDLKHFLKCYPAKPLPMSKLWKDPVAAATALGLAVTPFDPGGDADP
uniref:Uncharacterized protein n=1 Tax=Caenorhabditis japonica TaxID=281687 RepID=A0A8R1E657_CAEJA